jgi:hypothetical protein
MHKDREERNRYMREYRARQKRKITSVERKDGIVITSALTLGQFLREDMGFHHTSLDKFIEWSEEHSPEENKHITVYFLLPGYCVAIPDYA